MKLTPELEHRADYSITPFWTVVQIPVYKKHYSDETLIQASGKWNCVKICVTILD
jgi:hypothetical protein